MCFRPPGGDGRSPYWRALDRRHFSSRFAQATYACRAFAAVLLFAASTAKATTYSWTGNGGNVSWSTAGNWGGSAPVSDGTTDLIFAGTNNTGTAAAPLNNPTDPFRLNSLSFAAGAGTFFLGGAQLRFVGSTNLITQNSSSAQTVANPFVTDSGVVTIGLGGDGTGIVTISGSISVGSGQRDYAISKTGTSTFILSGANTYEGATTVSAGVLNVQNASGLGSTVGATSVADGAALQLQGGIAVGTEALTLNGSGIGQTGALRNISGDNSFAGTINLASAATVGSDAGNLTLSGVISGSNGLTKVGGGTLTLTGSNTFSGGLNVQNGTLRFATASLGASTNVITLGGSGTTGTLQYTGGGGTSPRTFTMATNGTGVVEVTSSAATLTFSGIVNGSGALMKSGSGTLQLNSVNTYGGTTSIVAGTLRAGGANVIPDASAVTVSAGANYDLNGFSDTIGSLTGAGTVTSGVTGSVTLTTGANNTSTTFSGLIRNGSGTVGVTKSGTGTLTLTGANTFSGSTTVTTGALVAAGTAGSALESTSSVTVNSGGTLLLGASDQINNAAGVTLAGGTLSKGNFSEGSATAAGMGALTLTASGSRIDFGSGTVGVLTFVSLSAGAHTLTIDNWTGNLNTVGSATTDRLIFNSSQASNLSYFSFTGYEAGATQFDLGGGYYEVAPMTAVPEPSTYLAAAMALLAVGFQQRARLKRLLARRTAGA